MAARRLLRSPGFALIAVGVLTIGIGANTTIFSLFNALRLKPLPGADPARLATVYTTDFSGPPWPAGFRRAGPPGSIRPAPCGNREP